MKKEKLCKIFLKLIKNMKDKTNIFRKYYPGVLAQVQQTLNGLVGRIQSIHEHWYLFSLTSN